MHLMIISMELKFSPNEAKFIFARQFDTRTDIQVSSLQFINLTKTNAINYKKMTEGISGEHFIKSWPTTKWNMSVHRSLWLCNQSVWIKTFNSSIVHHIKDQRDHSAETKLDLSEVVRQWVFDSLTALFAQKEALKKHCSSKLFKISSSCIQIWLHVSNRMRTTFWRVQIKSSRQWIVVLAISTKKVAIIIHWDV